VPAIDGLRALAVLAVLLFHAGFAGASGGYLGVSVFFTISGFVITRSLVERAATRPAHRAPLALGQFYARRVRRLLPASLATIVACTIAGRAGWLPTVSAAELRWTVLNGANWYQWRNDGDYAAVFAGRGGDRDPLVHFWSLAIEEQFYVVWPLVMLVLLRLPRRTATGAVAGLTVGLGAAVLAVGPNAGAPTVYYHTLFRAPEVLVGCLLALTAGHLTLTSHRVQWARWVGLAALAGVLVAVSLSGGSGAWPYQGLLPLFAVGSGLVILAATVPGPVATVLGARPLVEIGRVSYGTYLYHWPIFVVLFARGWSPTAVAALGIPLTLALAAASFHLAELRITRARLAVRPTLVGGLATVAAVVAATTLTAGPTSTTLALPTLDPHVLAAVDFVPEGGPSTPPPTAQPTTAPPPATASTDSSPPTASSTSPPPAAASTTSVGPTTVPAPRPMRVLVVGDSTAQSLSVGLTQWALDHTEVQVSVAAFGACGLMRGGEFRLGMLDAALQIECAERHTQTIPDALPLADVVVVLVTLADVWGRSWDGGTTWLGPADEAFRERLAADYAAFADQVAAAGVPTLLWLRPPVSSYGVDGGPANVEVSFTDGTQAWIESVIAELAATAPSAVAIADLRWWLEQSGLADDPAARPDGTHFSADAALQISDEWLVPQLLELPRRNGHG